MDNLVRNESLKLTANALDRASTAFVTIGVLAPIAASIYASGGAGLSALAFLGSVFVWLLCAIALHLGARFVLKGLSP
jgi:hypothetical protein